MENVADLAFRTGGSIRRTIYTVTQNFAGLAILIVQKIPRFAGFASRVLANSAVAKFLLTGQTGALVEQELGSAGFIAFALEYVFCALKTGFSIGTAFQAVINAVRTRSASPILFVEPCQAIFA